MLARLRIDDAAIGVADRDLAVVGENARGGGEKQEPKRDFCWHFMHLWQATCA